MRLRLLPIITPLKISRRLVSICGIVAAAFAVYWPSLRNGFVWDDTALILRDPFIRSWRLIPEGFRHFLFTDATASDFYRPLQRLSYTLDYALYAFGPRGYHLTNILLHAAAAVALFLFLQKWSGRWLPALLASLVWVVHPLHTSAVIYVAGRADLLAALFGFSALFLALENRGLFAAVCFMAAMLSKESGCIAMALWLLMLVFRRDFSQLRRWSAVAAVIVAVYCGLRFSAEKTPPPRTEPTRVAVRPILAARAWAEYAGLFVAPVRLHMERDVMPVFHGNLRQTMQSARRREYQTLLGVMLLGFFILWCRWARHADAVIFQALMLFLAAYLPVSNLLSLNATVAEHWLYMPGAFLAFAMLLSLDRSRWKTPLSALLVAWIACLGARTFLRNPDWRNQRAFLESTIRSGGDSLRMYVNLGQLESSEGRYDLAIQAFQKALQQKPDSHFAQLGLAATYLRMREYPQARAQLEKTLQVPFFRAKSLDYFATAESQETRKDVSAILLEAARLEPKNWPLQKRYIEYLDASGKTADAIAELRHLLEAQPFRAESWKVLGNLLLKTGQPALARRAYAQAAAYDVHDRQSREETIRLQGA